MEHLQMMFAKTTLAVGLLIIEQPSACVCDRLFFGEDVMRYRNNILVFIAVSNPVD
jgi:hypothetical protein